MAQYFLLPFSSRTATLYAHIRNNEGEILNIGTAVFGAYSGASWADYDLALTQQGSSGMYAGLMPALAAGEYHITAYEQAGANPAETDALAGTGTVIWDGEAFASSPSAATIADAVALELAATVASVTTLESRLTAARAGYLDLLTAMSTTLIKLLDTLELNAGKYRFTALSLALAPDAGDATEDKQDAILAAIAAMEDLAASTVAAAILETPANKLVTNASGQVVASNMRGTDSAYTGTPPTASAIAAQVAVQLAATLTSVSNLEGRLTAARAGYLDLLTLIKAVTDKVDTAFELDGVVYRLTANALEEAPDTSDATLAKQEEILAAVAGVPALILETPANLLATDEDGAVTVAGG